MLGRVLYCLGELVSGCKRFANDWLDFVRPRQCLGGLTLQRFATLWKKLQSFANAWQDFVITEPCETLEGRVCRGLHNVCKGLQRLAILCKPLQGVCKCLGGYCEL